MEKEIINFIAEIEQMPEEEQSSKIKNFIQNNIKSWNKVYELNLFSQQIG